jgi:hypothetical protein
MEDALLLVNDDKLMDQGTNRYDFEVLKSWF